MCIRDSYRHAQMGIVHSASPQARIFLKEEYAEIVISEGLYAKERFFMEQAFKRLRNLGGGGEKLFENACICMYCSLMTKDSPLAPFNLTGIHGTACSISLRQGAVHDISSWNFLVYNEMITIPTLFTANLQNAPCVDMIIVNPGARHEYVKCAGVKDGSQDGKENQQSPTTQGGHKEIENDVAAIKSLSIIKPRILFVQVTTNLTNHLITKGKHSHEALQQSRKNPKKRIDARKRLIPSIRPNQKLSLIHI
eukprot:TRINITY_DN11852_c0_g1_i1.p1 TRINITY_DN11852_c0_g1~~TRINITY_DN11852_c0_g1_i1.p1  ORF type:complete len:272 (-),score=47.64 TRINITY_DN11852_c0_g1_i1:33-788(-)